MQLLLNLLQLSEACCSCALQDPSLWRAAITCSEECNLVAFSCVCPGMPASACQHSSRTEQAGPVHSRRCKIGAAHARRPLSVRATERAIAADRQLTARLARAADWALQTIPRCWLSAQLPVSPQSLPLPQTSLSSRCSTRLMSLQQPPPWQQPAPLASLQHRVSSRSAHTSPQASQSVHSIQPQRSHAG